MKGHRICCLIVDAFNDINFATATVNNTFFVTLDTRNVLVGPVGTDHPKGRPCPADAARHVIEIQDDETFVVGFLARDSNTGSSSSLHVCMINTHVDRVPCS